ncbi:MAG: PTS sugar transporter subunit IIB [Firmicutes bacterium]|nr:PTS sugar transporter subunit IIB [Bacillota bacterium]
MRNIVLVCNMGVSTSLMVNRMKKAAKDEEYECNINAYAIQKARKKIEEADIILVGPQISYEIPRIKKEFPNKIVEPIAIVDYGKMDGVKVLNIVRTILGDI